MATNSSGSERLRVLIEALRAKTVENGCTQAEALSAAAKVADLLDRHGLSATDLDPAATSCRQAAWRSPHRKRVPLDDCVASVAAFCDCRVWRQRDASGAHSHVFFGHPADVDAAVFLMGMIDEAVRGELGRYKTSRAYAAFRHQDRHLANASFALGMVVSIAEKLDAMKRDRDRAKAAGGRDIVVMKAAGVEAEFAKLDLKLETMARRGSRMIAPPAFDAGEEAGSALNIAPGVTSAGPKRRP